MSATHTEPQPAAGACRPLDAGDPAACDFPTRWTIAPPGASHDDGSGSGIDVRPEPEVPQTTGHDVKNAAADEIQTIVESFLGEQAPLRVTCGDGSSFGEPGAPVGITITSPTALRRLLWNPGELGPGRAFVAGEIDVNGSIFDLLALRDQVAGQEQDVAPPRASRLVVAAGLGSAVGSHRPASPTAAAGGAAARSPALQGSRRRRHTWPGAPSGSKPTA